MYSVETWEGVIDYLINFALTKTVFGYAIVLLFYCFPVSLPLSSLAQIGGIEPKPRRDILMTDFEVVETAGFPA